MERIIKLRGSIPGPPLALIELYGGDVVTKYHAEKPFQIEVTRRFERLNEYVKIIEGSDERRASIVFVITNLLSQNCDKIESFGILEVVKEMLSSSDGENPLSSLTFYVV